MIEFELDGKPLCVPEGTTIIEAADQAGVYIPRFCYHKKLSIAANCRMCLIEVEKMGKPLPACATPITNDMKVKTKSEMAVKAQRDVMEFLLINHPLDCPICDQGGECELQDLSMGFGQSKSEYTESIHALRTNISFLTLSGNRKLLLVTSPSMGEGKSTVSINLAITYAQSGKRVLLVDTDIRNPSLYKYLARPKDKVGISNALINEIDFYDVVQKSILGVIGFDYLPGGDVPPNPVQLLESEKMRELLETAEHIYDLVILDTPPIGLFSDALLLARYADMVTLVTRYNKTSRKELLGAIDVLKKTNVTAIGVLLNGVPTGPQAGYGYGYYGYGRERYAEGQSAA